MSDNLQILDYHGDVAEFHGPPQTYAFIEINSQILVQIKIDDEGYVVDIFPHPDYEGDCLGTVAIPYDELYPRKEEDE